MTAFTTNFGWPKPDGTDSPDGPGQVTALANASDATVFGISAQLPYRARQTLGGSAASVTFSGIPSALRRLRVRWVGHSTATTGIQNLILSINGGISVTYLYQYLRLPGTGAPTTDTAATTATTFAVGALCGTLSDPTYFHASGSLDFVAWDVGPLTAQVHSFASPTNTPGNWFSQIGSIHFFNIAPPFTSLTLAPQTGSWAAGADFQLEGAVT